MKEDLIGFVDVKDFSVLVRRSDFLFDSRVLRSDSFELDFWMQLEHHSTVVYGIQRL